MTHGKTPASRAPLRAVAPKSFKSKHGLDLSAPDARAAMATLLASLKSVRVPLSLRP